MKTVNGTRLTTLDLLRKIIANGMSDIDQDRIAIYNQKWKMPTDEGLFIVLFFLGSKVVSNRVTEAPGLNALTEQYDLVTFERIQIEICSKNQEAMQRKEEIIMALLSSFSQNLQSEHAFKLNTLAPIHELSSLEATAMINRFSMDLTLFAWYSKTADVDYYKEFRGFVTTEVIVDDPFEIIIQQPGGEILADPSAVPILADPSGTPILND